MPRTFDFGINWTDYSKTALGEKSLLAAKESLKKLFGVSRFDGLRFLDIGCGSGIFSISAKLLGAREVLGFDLSPHSVEASRLNAAHFLSGANTVQFTEGNILDKDKSRSFGTFDLVYAWGSLHHTGSLWEAIEITCQTVKPGGKMVLGIYNKHWTSPAWLWVKKSYNASPQAVQVMIIFIFYPLIFAAKFFIIHQNPFRMRRGMNFYYDVVDWVGGYPYEAAKADEVVSFLKKKGFELKNLFPCALPTGNNEFLFENTGFQT